MFRFYTTRISDGARVENNKVIGKVSVLKTEKAAMAEAIRLGYPNLIATPSAATLTFKMLADHFIRHELEKTEGRIGRKASETVKRDKHNLNQHVTLAGVTCWPLRSSLWP